MPFHKEVVLPAAHAQQDLAQQRDVMPVLGIDRDLRGSTGRDLVPRNILVDVDEGERASTLRPRPIIDQSARGLDLARRDRIKDSPHPAFEYATRHGIERNLSLVARPNPLQ